MDGGSLGTCRVVERGRWTADGKAAVCSEDEGSGFGDGGGDGGEWGEGGVDGRCIILEMLGWVHRLPRRRAGLHGHLPQRGVGLESRRSSPATLARQGDTAK